MGGSSLSRVGMPVSWFRFLSWFLYPGSASPSAALLLSFLSITLEYRMLKHVFRVRAARRRGKAKKYFRFSQFPGPLRPASARDA